MATLRVRNPGSAAILNPTTGMHEVPDPQQQYDSEHPLVKAAPWAFASEEQIAADRNAASVESVRIADVAPVESATAAPGEKRSAPLRNKR